jgi:hypothetical protein
MKDCAALSSVYPPFKFRFDVQSLVHFGEAAKNNNEGEA